MAPDKLIIALGLETTDPRPAFTGNAAAGTLVNAQRDRVGSLPAPLLGALHFVLEKERAGSWRSALTSIGRACGKQLGTAVDTQLAALKQPALATLPLESALGFLVRHFALNAWGILKLDVSAAVSHGIVIAHLEGSWFAAALTDANNYADSFCTGTLVGYFEHISGQTLAGAELACSRRGAAHCTFLLTTQERLTPVLPLIGRETAEAIIARLKA